MIALAAGYLAFGWWGVALACLPVLLLVLIAAVMIAVQIAVGRH